MRAIEELLPHFCRKIVGASSSASLLFIHYQCLEILQPCGQTIHHLHRLQYSMKSSLIQHSERAKSVLQQTCARALFKAHSGALIIYWWHQGVLGFDPKEGKESDECDFSGSEGISVWWWLDWFGRQSSVQNAFMGFSQMGGNSDLLLSLDVFIRWLFYCSIGVPRVFTFFDHHFQTLSLALYQLRACRHNYQELPK